MSRRIRVTREFSFEMAHVLTGYDGPCRNVHGHSYKLLVTLAGFPLNNVNDPKNGMVIDFSDLGKIVTEKIIRRFDHSVVISDQFEPEKRTMLENTFGNTVVVSFQPTCENLVADFAERLEKEFPEGVKLHSLKLYETAKSYAEWYADDNE
jgi:6-pyruvoyltetrahydropterin/6-carboxytetrahydropterin synthase